MSYDRHPRNDGGGAAAPPPALLLSAVDRVLANLGDGNSSRSSGRRGSRRLGTDSASTHKRKRSRSGGGGSNDGVKQSGEEKNGRGGGGGGGGGDIIGRGAPPGLEAQYRQLVGVLRRGLLGSGDDDDDNEGGGGKSSSRGGGGPADGSAAANAPRNAAALLMGPRGHGKGLALQRALEELRRSSSSAGGGGEAGPSFRVVRLNGLLVRGDDVGAAVREIVRQLSDIAHDEHRRKRQSRVGGGGDGGGSAGAEGVTGGGDGGINIASDLLRQRRTSFASNLALLDETLRMAYVSSVPVLVVLEEMDAFLSSTGSGAGPGNASGGPGRGGRGRPKSSDYAGPSSSERQLLLYHLLDRVADHGSLLSLVGTTSRLSTVGTFEKRVKSRAEGTSRVIYFHHPGTYEGMCGILTSKFEVMAPARGGGRMHPLGDQLRNMLLPSSGDKNKVSTAKGVDGSSSCDAERVRAMFVRNYRLGKDVRWFCRVLSVALSLLVEDFRASTEGAANASDDATNTETGGGDDGRTTKGETEKVRRPRLTLAPHLLLEGLAAMGGSCATEESDRVGPASSSTSARQPRLSASESSNSARVGAKGPAAAVVGPFDVRGTVAPCPPGWDDPRLRSLLDLPPSQLSVLLAARRVLLRDAGRAADESSIGGGGGGGAVVATAPVMPLTYQRLRAEYDSTYGRAGGGKAGGERLGSAAMFRSFAELVETDLLRPTADGAGGGPLQFRYGRGCGSSYGEEVLRKAPLTVTVRLEEELGRALRAGWLDAPTGLRSWGLEKIH